MKLATLADAVKAAYRQGTIDTATAEAFASVPAERQLEVWQELGGGPQLRTDGLELCAQQVRSVIAHAWIEASAAAFDVSKLPDGAVSRDLFSERTLIERKAFMEAQADALLAERQALIDQGWAEVVVGPQAQVQERLWSMAEAPAEFDAQTTATLEKIADRRRKLEGKLAELDEGDEAAFESLHTKLDALDDQERALTRDATVHYAEATKAMGAAFLMLDPDGHVRRAYRIPRARPGSGGNGRVSNSGTDSPAPPTSDQLKEPQLAATFTHQALAVRVALLDENAIRRRILVLILHEKVRSEALAIHHEPNETTLHATRGEGFASAAWQVLQEQRAKVDPLHDKPYVPEKEAYEMLAALPEPQLDALIDLLTVECLSAHLQHRTDLVARLAQELGVQVRRYWRPDERWLAGYQKIQLVHLLGELRGAKYARAAEVMKKSDLVTEVARLFADAAEGRLRDEQLAEKVNRWLPANLRNQSMVVACEPATAV